MMYGKSTVNVSVKVIKELPLVLVILAHITMMMKKKDVYQTVLSNLQITTIMIKSKYGILSMRIVVLVWLNVQKVMEQQQVIVY